MEVVGAGSAHTNNYILDIPTVWVLLFLERPELVQHGESSPDVELVVLQV